MLPFVESVILANRLSHEGGHEADFHQQDRPTGAVGGCDRSRCAMTVVAGL